MWQWVGCGKSPWTTLATSKLRFTCDHQLLAIHWKLVIRFLHVGQAYLKAAAKLVLEFSWKEGKGIPIVFSVVPLPSFQCIVCLLLFSETWLHPTLRWHVYTTCSSPYSLSKHPRSLKYIFLPCTVCFIAKAENKKTPDNKHAPLCMSHKSNFFKVLFCVAKTGLYVSEATGSEPLNNS